MAEPDPRLRIRSLELKYDRSKPDGQRLILRVNGRGYKASGLPDWQIYPIADFADSDHFAVVTLFGELATGQRSVPDNCIVSFHPAFDGTLLGLRLFQSDVMLLDQSVMGELPRLKDRYVMHQSESPPNARLWQPAAAALTRLTSSAEFVSYVICDFERRPRFSVSPARRELILSGTPYFYFWRRGADKVEVRRNSPTRFTRISTFEVDQLEGTSEAVSNRPELLQQANPAVFHSATNTMRYSALFRYCRNRDGEMWQRFRESIEQIPSKDFRAPTPLLFPKQPDR